MCKSKPINMLFFLYRDLYFFNKFGYSVRDLHILWAAINSDRVNKIVVVNRPVSVYERLLGKTRCAKTHNKKVRVWDKTSFDLIGPTRGRAWTKNCYKKHCDEIYKFANFPKNENNILIDFTPLATIPYEKFGDYFLWYDAIDNFTKHNRYTNKQKYFVRKKYDTIISHAGLITATTPKLINFFGERNGKNMVLSNGVVRTLQPVDSGSNKTSQYDLGFIGFITNKMDLELLKLLSRDCNATIVLYGKLYNKKTKSVLKGMKNITLKSDFNEADIPSIMNTFKIGLIPYIKKMEHDGSPIKYYQYLAYKKPIISTHSFNNEIDCDSDLIIVANRVNNQQVVQWTTKTLNSLKFDDTKIQLKLDKAISQEMYWDNKFNKILCEIDNHETI